MFLQEILIISYRSIIANKLRSFLTMLGIIIGVGSVIAMISTGEGVQRAVTKSIKSHGTNMLYIRRARRGRSRIRKAAGSTGRLYNKDVANLTEDSRYLQYVSPEVWSGGRIVFRNKNITTTILGSFHFWNKMHFWKIQKGIFFGERENRGKMRVAVIGAFVKKELFGEEDPIGQTIKIRRMPFTVIGVLAEKGSSRWRNRDDIIIVPFFTAQARLFGRGTRVDKINIHVADEKDIPKAKEEIIFILRKSHKLRADEPNDFRIYDQADFIKMRSETTKTLTMLIASIAFISLIVGGIGIMNIMLVSVTERTKEIGLRKAVGARKIDIMVQFLVEAVMLSLIGGALGIVFGVGLSYMMTKISIFQGVTVELAIPPYAVILSFCFSSLIGILSGFYPAKKAAQMNPIDALRTE